MLEEEEVTMKIEHREGKRSDFHWISNIYYKERERIHIRRK